jgi:hypothetical protein
MIALPNPIAMSAWPKGCDAAHRAPIFDTHLTHACMPVFRRFLRLRRACAGAPCRRDGANPGSGESAARSLPEAER